jgi:D-3-phosphoglycerate dehydrogenase
MPKVVLVEPMHELAEKTFHAADGYEVVKLPAGASDADIRAAVTDADGIGVRIANLPRDLLADCPNLKVIAKHGVGCDNIDVDYCTERGIAVTVTADANAQSVCEHTLMMMLALSRKALPMDAATRAGDFKVRSRVFGFDLNGRTAMVIGVGRIGTRLISMLRAFHMNVIACDPLMSAEKAAELGCEKVEDFRAHLGRADVLTVHIPLNKENRSIIGAAELAALPDHAMVINCARGGIVNESALIEALNADQISCAGFDVFDGEPPPADHPFFKLENTILAPHFGGNTVECLERMATSCAENIIAVIQRRIEPRFVFNPDVLAKIQ